MAGDNRLKPYVAGLLADWLETTPRARHRTVDGSLAFVDISGFTRLTERLASTGKAGAEELSELLDRTFAQLLEVAYSYGAMLVKWGGDAVLLLFEGPDHAPLAVRAAYEMRALMRDIGRLQTSVGRVTLKMSVGVHSGRFDFFVAGDRHSELLIAGPAASRCAELEALAEAGEIAISSQTAALLPPTSVGAPKGDGLLVRRAPAVDPRCRWWPPREASFVYSGCMDPALAAHLDKDDPDHEHRQIGVAFIEVSAVDDLLVRQGPGAVAAELHRLVSNVQDACARYHVSFWETDISRDGFKILLVAGAPATSGHDEEGILRACRSVLDAHTGPIRIRVGANCGRVFVGDFGPHFRRTFSVKGDAVNLAARVMAKAHHGQLLATQAILARSRTRFGLTPLEPFLVKGKTQPVHAAAVGAVQHDQSTSAPRVPLVGRDQEVAALVRAVDSARAGSGGAVAVVGDAGIGKSRLVEELVRRTAADVRVLVSFCEDYESSTPYFALRALLREALGLKPQSGPLDVATRLTELVHERAAHLLEWLPLLALPLGVEVPDTDTTAAIAPEFRPQRVARLVVQLLELCLHDPALLVVEDAEHADEATRAVLARVAEAAATTGWLLVVVGRSVDWAGLEPHLSLRLPVPRLADESIAAIAHQVAGDRPLSPRARVAVVTRSDGNPLFAVELVDHVRTAADPHQLPDTLEEVVAAQVDELPPAARAVVRVAAVLGARFDEALLQQVLGAAPEPAVWQELGRLVTADADGTRRFRTPLLREAAYEGLPFRRRVILHGAVADAIEARAGDRSDDLSESLSLHCLVARRYAKAWRYAWTAATRAADLYANVDALILVSRAQAAARNLPELHGADRARLAMLTGDVHFRLAESEAAAAAYREARRRAPRDAPLLRAEAALQLAMVAGRLGDMTTELRWLSVARRDAGAVDRPTELQARIQVERAFARYTQGHLGRARRATEQAVSLAAAAGADAVRARALHLLDWVDLAGGGRGDERWVREALALFERSGDLHRQGGIWNHLGMRAFYDGSWDEAVSCYREARERFARCGDDWSVAIADANTAEILVEQGRFAEAEPMVVEALRVWRAARTPSKVGFGALVLGRLCGRAGRFDEAEALLAEATEAYRSIDEPLETIEVEMEMISTLVLRGAVSVAQHHLDGLTQRLVAVLGAERDEVAALHDGVPESSRQASGVALLQGYVEAHQGRADVAEARFRKALRVATLHGSRHEVLRSLDALWWLGASFTSEDEALRDQLRERLGIVHVPPLPPRDIRLPEQRAPQEEAAPAPGWTG